MGAFRAGQCHGSRSTLGVAVRGPRPRNSVISWRTNTNVGTPFAIARASQSS